MIITYHGGECIKMQVGDTVLAFNPIGKDSAWKPARFGANIALVTLNDPDFNGIDQVTYGDKAPFVISGPGEYEIEGIFIKGFYTSTTYHKTTRANTVYALTFDDIRVVFLGALGSPEALSGEIKEALGEVDMLFAPIAGGEVLDAGQAHKLAVLLESNILIPLHHGGAGDAAVKALEKEAGEKAEVQEKLTIKRKDLDAKEGAVIVLAV
ncbi:MAG: MBL fold metallo-hydrolase [Minisyncoccota bacterium]